MAKSRLWIPIVIAIVAVAAIGWRITRRAKGGTTYRTEQVQRGDVKVQVSATGTLNAVTTVQVGSQISGTISALSADYNDRVHAGQVLAQLDPTFLKAQVAQSRADLVNSQVQVRQAERDSSRIFPLGAQGLASKADLDKAQTALDAARAGVASSSAALVRAETNLRYATITSPIDGIVVSRNVDVGQTVAASLSAPTLFTIANDLTQMQLEAAVDEADIGMVKVGQPATFTVDAFPDLTFSGEVQQIRLQPETVQNVVTYTVVIHVANPEQKLLPGMTANVTIQVDQANDVLKVPAMALRFRPAGAGAPGGRGGAGGNGGARAQGVSGQARQAGGAGATGQGGGAGQGGGPAGQSGGRRGSGGAGFGQGGPAGSGEGGGAGGSRGVVFVLAGGKPHPVRVRPGLSDGTFTAVYSDSLREGEPVIIAADNAGGSASGQQQQVNPFAPRMGGGRR